MAYDDYVNTVYGFRQRDLTPRTYDDAYAQRYRDIDDEVVALSARRLQVLEAFVPHGVLLDFGAGTFRFVDAAQRAGWSAWGYDVILCHHSRRQSSTIANCRFDVVTFFDSLEHLPDPTETIKALDPQWLMISIPECHYPENEAWFMAWKHRRPGEHLWHWNRLTLTLMMDGLGYRCRMISDFEDDFRPNPLQKQPNILTAIFQRR